MGATDLTIPGRMFAQSRFARDMLDACVAALTADLYLAGNATKLGDGYGAIVIPGVLQMPFGDRSLF